MRLNLTRFGGRLDPHRVRRLAALLVVLSSVGCRRDGANQVTVTDGAAVTRFTVRSAFGEYVELPGLRNELRLTLASYGVSCERWVAPAEGDAAVLVTIVLPPSARPTATAYPWTGLPAEAAAGAPGAGPYALPKALLGRRSRLFEPGGVIRLSSVELDAHGVVAGTLAFEFPGAADRPATRVDGSFEAPLCRISRAQQ